MHRGVLGVRWVRAGGMQGRPTLSCRCSHQNISLGLPVFFFLFLRTKHLETCFNYETDVLGRQVTIQCFWSSCCAEPITCLIWCPDKEHSLQKEENCARSFLNLAGLSVIAWPGLLVNWKMILDPRLTRLLLVQDHTCRQTWKRKIKCVKTSALQRLLLSGNFSVMWM